MKETIQITPLRGGKPFNCHIIGDPNAPPVLYTGGVVYGEMLAELASTYGIKLICPEIPYWHNKPVSDMGYASVKDITLDSMLDDLNGVIKCCVHTGHIPSVGGVHSYAVAGGSYPGWLATALKNRDPNCVAVNLFATPVPALKPEEAEKEKNIYLQKNDLLPPEKRNLPISQTLGKAGPGIRATLFEEEKNRVVASEPLLENYRRTNHSLFWQNPQCDDRDLWRKSDVSPEFFQRFFEIIHTADSNRFKPHGETLIVAGIHDFTIPYEGWINFLKSNDAKRVEDHKDGMLFYYQGSKVRLVCSEGGHLTHALHPEPLQKGALTVEAKQESVHSSLPFTPDPSLTTIYRDWISNVKDLIEARNPAPAYSRL